MLPVGFVPVGVRMRANETEGQSENEDMGAGPLGMEHSTPHRVQSRDRFESSGRANRYFKAKDLPSFTAERLD